MATPAEIITARAETIATEYAARIPALISLATEQTGSGFGARRNDAIAMLVLHWLEGESVAGGGGALTSEKEGELSRSYAASSGDGGDLSETRWGRERLRLMRGSGLGLPRNRMAA